MNRPVALFFACLLGVASSRASASISTYADPDSPFGAGAHNITVDLETSMEWLDWDATGGITYSVMVSRLADPTDPLFGWTYATLEQVGVLFENLGLPVSDFPNNSSATGDGPTVHPALVTLGAQTRYDFDNGGSQIEARAITASPVDPSLPSSSLYMATAIDLNFAPTETNPAPLGTVLTNGTGSISPNIGNLFLGHALYRTTETGVVPEPVSLAVWGGITAAVWIGVWQKRRTT